MDQANFGVLGLGVMGHMLALNIERNGFQVAGFDLDLKKVDAFEGTPRSATRIACRTIPDFLDSIQQPRRILLMVPAGRPVDSAIEALLPGLTAGDLLIDGGNSYFADTDRRALELEAKGIRFIGAGVSGGEQGALWGPSLMPGGQRDAWELIQPVFEAIAAKVDGEPCVAYMGKFGAGHYVKMVHNGIEYGDMQLIAEAYDILHSGLGLENEALASVFTSWNDTELESYLIEITAKIFRRIDSETGQAVVDLILDEAGQKGTGKWTSQNALDVGVAAPTIHAAVDSRILSANRAERLNAAAILTGPTPSGATEFRPAVVEDVRVALYAAKVCSYAQGFSLLHQASIDFGYELNLKEIARIWRGGCIIRARFLDDIRAAYERDPRLSNLMLDPHFSQVMNDSQTALRRVVAFAGANGIPVLALSSALAYYDAFRSRRLPANLTQAQRDYFGAHTYRRLDREGIFHTDWQAG